MANAAVMENVPFLWEGTDRKGNKIKGKTIRKLNLAAFDLVFPPGETAPVFLEINYTFGRTGLGGSEKFYILLQNAVDHWLQASP